MKLRHLIIGLSLASFFLIPSQRAGAQRQIAGRDDVAFWGTGIGEIGGGAAWYHNTYAGRFTVGAYTGFLHGGLLGSVETGADGQAEAVVFEGGYRRCTIMASGGYQWRLFGTRNRIFSAHAGPSLDMGGMFYFAPEGEAQEKGLPSGGFVLGASLNVDLELFLFRRLSLLVTARPRVQFVTSSVDKSSLVYDPSERWFVPVVGGGLIYYF